MTKTKRTKLVLLYGIVFSIMGTIAFVLGPREWMRINRLHSEGIEVTGRVVKHESAGKGTFAPVIAYTGPDKTARLWTSDIASSNPYGVGTAVTLYVDPDDPANVALSESGYSFTRDFAIVAMMIFGILGYSNLGWLLWRWIKRKK